MAKAYPCLANMNLDSETEVRSEKRSNGTACE